MHCRFHSSSRNLSGVGARWRKRRKRRIGDEETVDVVKQEKVLGRKLRERPDGIH